VDHLDRRGEPPQQKSDPGAEIFGLGFLSVFKCAHVSLTQFIASRGA